MKKVSVIIPTFKRKNSLVKLLKSIMPQLNSDCEIIIVEQGNNNKNVYESELKKSSAEFTYIYETIPSTEHAKNIGAKKSEGDILLFLDDDVVVHDNLIVNHLKGYRDKKIGGVSGRVITPGEKIEEDRTDTGRIDWLIRFSNGYSSTHKQNVDTGIGCNMSWRRDIFELLGGYDENFHGLRDESDLALRVKYSGFKILFEPSATVTHIKGDVGGTRKSEGRLKWYRYYFNNETYFFLKHRNKFFLPLMLLTRLDYILRCMFGFGREVSLRSIATPFLGIKDGINNYFKYKNGNRS